MPLKRTPNAGSCAKQKADASLQHLGIGIDTARYGHYVCFLREDKERAAAPLPISESRAGYQQLESRLRLLQARHPEAHFHIRIDAAGQYATNLETFLRALDLPKTVSVGEPKRNKDYHRAHSPKRKSDATESYAMARYGVVERPRASHAKPAANATLQRVATRLQAQVKQSTRLTNQLHETLSATFPELATIVTDISTGWVLALLSKYPTSSKIAAARLSSLQKIPHLKPQKAEQIHAAARESVGTLNDAIAQQLIGQLIDDLRHSLAGEVRWKALLVEAFDALPPGPHKMIESIKGIGKLTAAAIVATAVSIDRFETAKRLVGYYGIFPEEFQSGVDKFGKPIPAGKKRMCPRGNDLVRGLLWNCAKSASLKQGGNPALRALYLRLIAAGKTPYVAWGYCMAKLLKQTFGVWRSGKAFDPEHETKGDEKPGTSTQEKTPATSPKAQCAVEQAEQEVTVAEALLEPVKKEPVDPSRKSKSTPYPLIDFAALRERVSLEQALTQLGALNRRRPGIQYRGPCPLHEDTSNVRSRNFSAHLEQNIFRCFHKTCNQQGNVLDLWAAYHNLKPYQAAVHLAATFAIDIPYLQDGNKHMKKS